MIQGFTTIGLRPVYERESLYVVGGVDKEAQNVLYLIGYALGVVCKFISKLFTKGF